MTIRTLLTMPALVLFLMQSLCLSAVAQADNMTFIKEYTYMASDIDSKVSSRAIALELTKRALLEELGTYLISETAVRNYQITIDQISILTAGIVSADVIDERWDGRTYYLKAKIVADPKEVAKSVDALRKDDQKRKELAESKAKADEALREVDCLKKELVSIKADVNKQSAYTTAINNLTATDWFERGLAFQDSNDFERAIDAYTHAIRLSPQFAIAYINRGLSYGHMRNLRKALQDFDKAIELDPSFAGSYYNRGLTHGKLGNQKQEMADYDTAINLNPVYADAYYSRGLSYSITGNTKQAISDLDKAIKFNPQFTEAYYTRGLAYGLMGNDKMSVQDLKIAAKLGDKNAQSLLQSMKVSY